MKRIIYNDVIEWKNKKVKKPLIIKGARQVGKTYIIREFAKNNYKNLVEINFERDHEFQELFKQTKTAHDLLQYIELTYMDIQFDNDLGHVGNSLDDEAYDKSYDQDNSNQDNSDKDKSE